jgi:hypothetical protein
MREGCIDQEVATVPPTIAQADGARIDQTIVTMKPETSDATVSSVGLSDPPAA